MNMLAAQQQVHAPPPYPPVKSMVPPGPPLQAQESMPPFQGSPQFANAIQQAQQTPVQNIGFTNYNQ